MSYFIKSLRHIQKNSTRFKVFKLGMDQKLHNYYGQWTATDLN